MNKDGYWPYTPNTNLLYGLSESLDMLLGEGLDNVFARHQRWAAGVRAAVNAWGLPIQCADPAVYSPVLTGVITPEGVDADALRRLIHQRFDLSLGTGLGKLKGRMFRMGHLGDSNDLTLRGHGRGRRDGHEARGHQAGRQRRARDHGPFREPRGASGAAEGCLAPAALQKAAPAAFRLRPTPAATHRSNDAAAHLPDTVTPPGTHRTPTPRRRR
jgi:hypothetical protein